MLPGLENRVASVAERIVAGRATADRPFLIAIDGGSGAGKSTFAGLLSRRLDAALVSGDDFYAGGTGLHRLNPKELAEICIDRARLRAVLQRLKSNQTARYAPFDWAAFDGGLAEQETIVQPRPIIILEGVYAFHPELRDQIDFSVLLRVPQDERERRLLAREGGLTEWERQWHRAEDWYFANLARPEVFDLVVCNL